MAASSTDIALKSLQLRFKRLRYELGRLENVTGIPLGIVVVACGGSSCMVAVVAAMVCGLLTLASLATAAILGMAIGSGVACVLMPVFHEIKVADIAEAENRVHLLRQSLAAQQERWRALEATAARVAEHDRQVAAERLVAKTNSQPASARTRGWGSGVVCWYCRQPMQSTSIQCCYCHMLNTSRVA
jgi:hypothetical protein